MTLKRRLDEEEIALLEILEDPIWFSEFLRNTADASPLRDEWPKVKFAYRWYQRDMITDQSEFILVRAARAVGKCSPVESLIYTHPYGYISIRQVLQLLKSGPVYVYAINPTTRRLEHRRVILSPNGRRETFTVKTKLGYKFIGTENHPILTQEGYKQIGDLSVGTLVATTKQLPHESQQSALNWSELRMIGYYFDPKATSIAATKYHKLKYATQVSEFAHIARELGLLLEEGYNGIFRLTPRRSNRQKHYLSVLMRSWRMLDGLTKVRLGTVPLEIKGEKLDNIKVFLESFLSMYAEIDSQSVRIEFANEGVARGIQELLLRFGCRTSFRENVEFYELKNVDYADYYNLFSILEVPGLRVVNLRKPHEEYSEQEFIYWDSVESIESNGGQTTYAVHVHMHENYISDGLFVHNSLVLEDKLLYEMFNNDIEFPVTKEETLVTANYAQMSPILDRLIMRISGSPLFNAFIYPGSINRSKGTIDMKTSTGVMRLNARIAGQRGEQNMVCNYRPLMQ